MAGSLDLLHSVIDANLLDSLLNSPINPYFDDIDDWNMD
jgi:hypothetical protein